MRINHNSMGFSWRSLVVLRARVLKLAFAVAYVH
jgi:hypothetical protein